MSILQVLPIPRTIVMQQKPKIVLCLGFQLAMSLIAACTSNPLLLEPTISDDQNVALSELASDRATTSSDAGLLRIRRQNPESILITRESCPSGHYSVIDDTDNPRPQIEMGISREIGPPKTEVVRPYARYRCED